MGADGYHSEKFEFAIDNLNDESYKILQDTNTHFGYDEIKVGLTNADKVFAKQEKQATINDFPINLSLLSSGLKSLTQIQSSLRILKNRKLGLDDITSIFVLIEEPENSLHPDKQKQLPQVLDSFLSELPGDVMGKCHIMVTTHSPFIISNSRKFENKKVFPMSAGCFLDLNGQLVNESAGFSQINTLTVEAKMLGAEIVDIGYPENFCILEEDSLLKILQHSSDIGITRKIAYMSASGWTRVENYMDLITQIQNFTTLLKCNPLYETTYLVILDNVDSDRYKPAEKVMINTMKKSMGARLTMLTEHSLEDYYSNLNRNLKADFDREYYPELPWSEKGKLKGKYAMKIANLIVTKEDFSTLFNGELDHLLL